MNLDASPIDIVSYPFVDGKKHSLQVKKQKHTFLIAQSIISDGNKNCILMVTPPFTW